MRGWLTPRAFFAPVDLHTRGNGRLQLHTVALVAVDQRRMVRPLPRHEFPFLGRNLRFQRREFQPCRLDALPVAGLPVERLAAGSAGDGVVLLKGT